MTILERYLTAIERRLPWRTRRDIVEEIRSAIEDQLENEFGEEAGDEEISLVLTKFGAPNEVAARYRGDNILISGHLTDIYLLLIAILAGALLLAFSVIAVIEIIENTLHGRALLMRILGIPLPAFTAWISGVGVLSLVFIGVSRIPRLEVFPLSETWSPDQLEVYDSGGQKESAKESIFSLVSLTVLVVGLNLYPGIVNLAERLFERSGILLQHHISSEVFRSYVIALSIVWIFSIALRAICLSTGEKRSFVLWGDVAASIAEAGIDGLMLLNPLLYGDDAGWLGFRLIFAVALIANTAEGLSGILRIVRRRIVGAGSA